MTAIKASDVDRFIAKPDPAQPIVLVFGPDAGLVRERVDALVRASVDDPNDPFALARIEGEELSANPARLVEKRTPCRCSAAAAPCWCGSSRATTSCRDRDGARSAVARLPRHHRGRRPAQDRAAARAVREGQGRGAALPCYPDDARRSGAADRRRDARGQADARARRARGACRAARRRPARLAQRNPQARALCPGPATRSSSPT